MKSCLFNTLQVIPTIMTTILPSILFGQGFLDLHELAVARSVCREWRDDLSAVFAYDVKRVFPKLCVDSANVTSAFAYAKSIHMRLDGRDPQDLVDALQDEVLNEAHISHERLVDKIFPALANSAGLAGVFSPRHLLMWCAESRRDDDSVLEFSKDMVVLAEDSPASQVIECIEFMKKELSAGRLGDYWMCATMTAVLNTDAGSRIFECAGNRGNLKAKMNDIIKANPRNKPLMYAAYMIKHCLI